jgi:hypothetical protein
VLLLNRNEQIVELADILGRSKKKITVRPQRVVKGRNHLALRVGTEIDQQISA